MRMAFEKESNKSKASPSAKVSNEKKCTFEKAMRMDFEYKHARIKVNAEVLKKKAY